MVEWLNAFVMRLLISALSPLGLAPPRKPWSKVVWIDRIMTALSIIVVWGAFIAVMVVAVWARHGLY